MYASVIPERLGLILLRIFFMSQFCPNFNIVIEPKKLVVLTHNKQIILKFNSIIYKLTIFQFI